MNVDKLDVPTPVVAHWQRVLGDAPPAALKTPATAHRALQAGFLPGKVPPAQLRTWAKAILDTSAGLPEAAIEQHAAVRADAFGHEVPFGAIHLGGRATVRSAISMRFTVFYSGNLCF